MSFHSAGNAAVNFTPPEEKTRPLVHHPCKTQRGPEAENCSFSWRSPKGGGEGGRSLLLSQKAYCRTHLMFLTPILPSPLTLPPPFPPEISFELQSERRNESGYPAVSCSTVPAVLPRRGSSCSSKKDRQLHGHVDDER
ncbi:hypothetical protein Q8A67_016462 [Cirrhinus molitorella]|uniref:Uncharacterized protein n=1 Tax=Cirrhinus molitorella TaxID=172907 RepID=A0AA88PK36_9TELE|nr:hypothetical protein Q8A67_016462 [Cirrhinus molitorella]